MRKARLLQILIAVACALAAAQTPSSKTSKSAVKKTTPSSSKKTVSSGKKLVAPPRTTASAKKSTPTKKGTKTAVSGRAPAQRTPTSDRYKEIQQALASKGYLDPASPSGVWDEPSVTALKKFQEDQNLEPSGKIDSLSLIALGLGPRRDQPTVPIPQP